MIQGFLQIAQIAREQISERKIYIHTQYVCTHWNYKKTWAYISASNGVCTHRNYKKTWAYISASNGKSHGWWKLIHIEQYPLCRYVHIEITRKHERIFRQVTVYVHIEITRKHERIYRQVTASLMDDGNWFISNNTQYVCMYVHIEITRKHEHIFRKVTASLIQSLMHKSNCPQWKYTHVLKRNGKLNFNCFHWWLGFIYTLVYPKARSKGCLCCKK
jgi:hypothetical protein